MYVCYSLDGDPAPVYGNVNFTYMDDFMFYEAQTSPKRDTIYHPETNYWVSGERLCAEDEEEEEGRRERESERESEHPTAFAHTTERVYVDTWEREPDDSRPLPNETPSITLRPTTG